MSADEPDWLAIEKVMIVHACLWHQHPGCKAADRPSSNNEYWKRKLDRNVVRDGENYARLEYLGWEVLVIWECETRDDARLLRTIRDFLGNTRVGDSDAGHNRSQERLA